MTRIDGWRSYKIVGAVREAARVGALAAGLGAAGGCSIVLPGLDKGEEPLTTQSTGPRAAHPLSADLGDEDWRRAKAALAVALDPQGPGTMVSWDNPDTTIKGHFTPVGQPYVRNDEICRSFLAMVHGQGAGQSLQGTACRPSGGEWTIKEIKPAKGAVKV